jgi:hypothetical protein
MFGQAIRILHFEKLDDDVRWSLGDFKAVMSVRNSSGCSSAAALSVGRPATSSWKKSRTTSEGFVITLLFMVKRILVTISERTGSFRAGP